MKKSIYSLLTLCMAFAFGITSCSDDETPLAKAILASVNDIYFDAANPQSQIFNVTSDGDWTVETPDWITVTPSSGRTGRTEVTITVTKNTDENGELNLPRIVTLKIKGLTSWATAEVAVHQEGNKFRGVSEIPVAQIANLKDGDGVILASVNVMDVVGSTAFVADGSDIVMVTNPTTELKRGDRVSISGAKGTDSNGVVCLSGEEIRYLGADDVPNIPAQDITKDLDNASYTFSNLVSVTGSMKSGGLEVEGKTKTVQLLGSVNGISISSYAGHKVTLVGYYCGNDSKVLKMMVGAVIDLGVEEVIYWSEDFEWLAPWSEASGTGDRVSSNDEAAKAVQIGSAVYNDITAKQALEEKGYKFIGIDKNMNPASAYVYLQINYLDFGKTDYRAGMEVTGLKDIPQDKTLELCYDWGPMRRGNGKLDPITPVVEIVNGDKTTTLTGTGHDWEVNHKLGWIPQVFSLAGITVDENTIIRFKIAQWEDAANHRWFIDNIKIRLAQ